jgi:AAA+ ATPase superfamily predicted ATPase
MFLYREKEVNLLEVDFQKPRSTISFIFGRRKVGKTSLINFYTKEKRTLYLSCFEAVEHLVIGSFKKSIDTFFDNNNLEKLNTLEDIFSYISEQKIDNKIVIILENVNLLIKNDKDFFTKLNSYWLKTLKTLNIQFILSSSIYPNSFEKHVIYKKIDNDIILKSLSFNIIKQLLPTLNKDDAMYVYSAFGTNPHYLKLYDEKKDFLLNIKDNFLLFESTLFDEGMNIIKKDLSDVVTYCSILYAISLGNNKIGDIANHLELKSSYLTRYLQKLVDLMIITKNIPINENPLKSKFGRYEIEDNFLKFWFCYIYPNNSTLSSNNLYPVLKHIRKDFSTRLVVHSYKKYVKELLEYDTNKFFDYIPKNIGSWWNNGDLEIDFIAYDSKTITFIDSKWRKNNTLESSYKELKNKAKNFNTTLEKKYIIFSKKANNQ